MNFKEFETPKKNFAADIIHLLTWLHFWFVGSRKYLRLGYWNRAAGMVCSSMHWAHAISLAKSLALNWMIPRQKKPRNVLPPLVFQT